MSAYLQECAKVEKTLAQAYRILSDRFQFTHLELGDLFRTMADEEEAHASKIIFADRLHTYEGEILDTQTSTSSEFLKDLKQRSQNLLKFCEEGELPIRRMVELTAALESEFQMLHIEKATNIKEPELARLFMALAGGDDAHARSINKILSLCENELNR